MPYNIDAIEILSNDGLAISRSDLVEAQEACDYFAESSVFDEDWPSQCCKERDGLLQVECIWWQGECSGRSWPEFLEHVATAFIGKADLLVVWEGGDKFEGIRIDNGEVTEHEVVQALGKMKK